MNSDRYYENAHNKIICYEHRFSWQRVNVLIFAFSICIIFNIYCQVANIEVNILSSTQFRHFGHLNNVTFVSHFFVCAYL